MIFCILVCGQCEELYSCQPSMKTRAITMHISNGGAGGWSRLALINGRVLAEKTWWLTAKHYIKFADSAQ